MRWLRAVGGAALLLSICLPSSGQSRNTTPATAAVTGDAARVGLYPELKTRREVVISALGAGLLVTGHLLPVTELDVPVGGLDPADIAWSADRRTVGHRDTGANTLSNWTRNASVAFPLALAFVSAAPGERWHGLGVNGVVYAETLLFSQGSTLLTKTIWSRPRPFTYLSDAERPADASYDVTQTRAFRSMPSGHSSSAWTGAALGITEHLLSRPDASWVERVGVGFVGGGLAGATSTLRVTAGQHFPSDVLAGAGIGIATGVAIPLLHRGDRSLPSSKAWLESMGGTLAGTLVAILVTR